MGAEPEQPTEEEQEKLRKECLEKAIELYPELADEIRAHAPGLPTDMAQWGAKVGVIMQRSLPTLPTVLEDITGPYIRIDRVGKLPGSSVKGVAKQTVKVVE